MSVVFAFRLALTAAWPKEKGNWFVLIKSGIVVIHKLKKYWLSDFSLLGSPARLYPPVTDPYA